VTVHRFPLELTGRFNRLMTDLVANTDAVRPFFHLPNSVESYAAKMAERQTFAINRPLLADALLRQYASIGGANASVLANIEALREANTFTVTTGHQLNIFTGPLYFVYKILHAVRLAEELGKAYPDKRFVPVYWMNAEDHDREEIGQFNVFGRKFTWETDQTGATGHMNPSSLEAFCSELETIFASNAETLQMVAVFRKAYTTYTNLATATRYFVNALFWAYGLVIIDGDDADLKREFIPFLQADILENRPFELVRTTNAQLEKAGYHVQVNPREINTFYLTETARERIVRTDKGFHVLHTELRFTEAELLAELENHPERFSPNVVLRPLYQEFLLPNLAYIGGAGELSYWLQYRSYFQAMGISYPILALRNHFLLIDGASSKRMDELKLLPEDLFVAIDQLVKNHLFELEDADMQLTDEAELLAALYAKLKDRALDVDPTLVASIDAEEVRLQKGLEQWAGRFTRALKKKNEVSVGRIEKLHAKLFPNGYLQERHDNFLVFHSMLGNGFFKAIHAATDPFSQEFGAIRFE